MLEFNVTEEEKIAFSGDMHALLRITHMRVCALGIQVDSLQRRLDTIRDCFIEMSGVDEEDSEG